MRVSHQTLQKYTVQTASGEVLGKISDIVYDCDSFTIVQFIVSGGILKSHLYHIHPHQIISITSACITVQDTVDRIVRDDMVQSRRPGTSTAMMQDVDS
jgi:uncharacterized protein YrrD